MMATLNLFPARASIGTANVAGIEVPVYMTPEFFRAISDLLQRVGGPSGTATSDIEEMAIQSLAPVVDMFAFIGADALQSIESAAAVNIAMQAANDALAAQIEQAGALLADLRRRCDDLDVTAGYSDPFRVDWEHPGTIGSITANSGAFTTMSATGQITSTLATGTAPFVITSTTKVTNLNVDLLDGSDWGTPGAIGSTTANTGRFTTVTATGAFGCNGKTAQTAFALGAAATDLPTVITLANNMRTALINNGIGS